MIVKVYSWCALVTKASCRQQDVKVHSLRLHPDHRLDKGQCFIVMCTGIYISMYIFVQMAQIFFIWLCVFLSVLVSSVFLESIYFDWDVWNSLTQEMNYVLESIYFDWDVRNSLTQEIHRRSQNWTFASTRPPDHHQASEGIHHGIMWLNAWIIRAPGHQITTKTPRPGWLLDMSSLEKEEMWL